MFRNDAKCFGTGHSIVEAAGHLAHNLTSTNQEPNLPSGVSNVNYTTATSIANGAIAPTEDDGTFRIKNRSSGTNAVTVKVDITGWILD